MNWPPGAPGRVSAKSAVSLFRLKAASSVDLLHLFQERLSFSALRKIENIEKTREIIHLFQIFRFSTRARVVVVQRPVAVLCSIPECRDSSPSLRGRRSLRRRARFVRGLRRYKALSANKNRNAPIETEISIKTAPRDAEFHEDSTATLNRNRISIKTALHRADHSFGTLILADLR